MSASEILMRAHLAGLVALGACHTADGGLEPADTPGDPQVRAVVADTAAAGTTARIVLRGRGLAQVVAYRLVLQRAERVILESPVTARHDTLLALELRVPRSADTGRYDVTLRYRRGAMQLEAVVREVLAVVARSAPTSQDPAAPTPKPADPPDGCGAFCVEGLSLAPGEMAVTTVHGPDLMLGDLSLRVLDAKGAKAAGIWLGRLNPLSSSSGDLWVSVGTKATEGTYYLEATLAEMVLLVPFLKVPAGRIAVLDLAEGERDVEGRLASTGIYCRYAWDIFAEFPEPCRRLMLRVAETGTVHATLAWSPEGEWMSLHDEREPSLPTGLVPPMRLSLAVTPEAPAPLVVGIHGLSLATPWPDGREIAYTLRLRFEPSTARLGARASGR